MDSKELIDKELEFASTINEGLFEGLKGWNLVTCPYCGKRLRSNRNTKEGKERIINTTYSEQIKTRMEYMKCSKCGSFTKYKPSQAPVYKITSALFMIIVFTPDVGYYQLEEKFGLSRYTVMNVRTKYKVLIDIMIKFKDVFHPDNFEEFMNYYENENNLTEFRKLVDIEIPTGENANDWLYKYIIKKNS